MDRLYKEDYLKEGEYDPKTGDITIGNEFVVHIPIDAVEIELSTENWTSKDVVVELKYKGVPSGYWIEYKNGNGNWVKGTNLTVSSNTTIIGRLYNETTDTEMATSTKVITNIDKIEPTKPTDVDVVANIDSIVIKGNGSTDENQIVGYKYSHDGSNWTDSKNDSYSIFGLSENTTVKVYIKAIDKAGNESDVYTENVNTLKSNASIVIAKNPGNLTNGNVTVTMNGNDIPTGYVLQYKIGTGNWVEGSSVVITSNTTVTTRLNNGSSSLAQKEIQITNIDKTAPTMPTLTSENIGLNMIEVTGTGSTDVIGLAGYKYSQNGSNWSTTKNDTYVVDNLKPNTPITIYVKAVDNAGNESAVYTENVTTSNITSTVQLARTPNGYTNGNVTVNLSFASIPAGYQLQYKVGTGSWIAGNSVVVTTNTTVVGRLYNANIDSEISVNSVAITTIDKTVPSEPTSIDTPTSNGNIMAKANGSTDTGSGLAGYKYRIGTQGWSNTILAGTEYKLLEGFEEGTTYAIYAKAIDNAGNESQEFSVSRKIEKLTVGGKGDKGYIGLEIGDFIEYNAGTWIGDEVVNATDSNGGGSFAYGGYDVSGQYVWEWDMDFGFGGFKAGTSRDASAEPTDPNYQYVKTEDGRTLAGWRVFDIDKTSGTITLISAGNPEDYKHLQTTKYNDWYSSLFATSWKKYYATYISEAILTGENTNMSWGTESWFQPRDWSMYINAAQTAKTAQIVREENIEEFLEDNSISSLGDLYSNENKQYQTLIDNNSYYWCPKNTANTGGDWFFDNWGQESGLSYFSPENHQLEDGYTTDEEYIYGVRMLVTLKDKIQIQKVPEKAVTIKNPKYVDSSSNVWEYSTHEYWKILP